MSILSTKRSSVNASAVARAVGCAVAMLTACGSAADVSWRAVEQPDLQAALEKVPVLKTESLGEPARGVNVWERWLVPNLDGKSWDVLQIYFKEYYGPTWLFAIDLATGQAKKQRLPDGHQFYLSGRALGFDGKYYIATPSRKTWSMDLFVYDPAANAIEERGEIVHLRATTCICRAASRCGASETLFPGIAMTSARENKMLAHTALICDPTK